MNKAGMLYLVFGSVAAALMGFTGREIATAFRLAAGRPGPDDDRRKSAYFWEAAARNAWMLGALGSALNFTIALGSDSPTWRSSERMQSRSRMPFRKPAHIRPRRHA